MIITPTHNILSSQGCDLVTHIGAGAQSVTADRLVARDRVVLLVNQTRGTAQNLGTLETRNKPT